MLPLMDDWSILYYGDVYEAPELRDNILRGAIHNDIRFDDGEYIRTSRITKIDLVDGFIQTRNTKYKLGKVDPKYYQWCKDNKLDNLSLDKYL